jgi:hypothetical protein
LAGGDALDQFFFAGANGTEAVVEVLEEEEEFVEVLAGDDVLAGAETVGEAIAAGCGFAFGGTRASRFLAF